MIPASKVKVVYLGVPLEEFSRERSAAEIAAARRELGIGAGEFAVGTVTRLHDSKGNSYLVDAAARVVRARPGTRFYLVGEGPLLGDLQAQAAALGLGDRFVFAGFRRDVAGTLSAFDLSVFPSLWEGTPITAFEALAMGKPIVSTDADGLLDILTANHDAVIVPKRNAEALADESSGRSIIRTSARACRPPPVRRAADTTSTRSFARWNGWTRCCTTCRARRAAGACRPRSRVSDVGNRGPKTIAAVASLALRPRSNGVSKSPQIDSAGP